METFHPARVESSRFSRPSLASTPRHHVRGAFDHNTLHCVLAYYTAGPSMKPAAGYSTFKIVCIKVQSVTWEHTFALQDHCSYEAPSKHHIKCGNLENTTVSFFWASCRSRSRRWAAVRLSHRPKPPCSPWGQAVQSMGWAMNWTVEDNMVDSLFFRATLTGRKGGHTPSAQAGTEASDTGAEVVKPDPRFSWKGRSKKVGSGVGHESAEFCRLSNRSESHWCSAQTAARMLLWTGANGCLVWRRRAFALGGQVSAEWSRYPGSKARRDKDSVALLRRSPAGWMPARMGRLSAGASNHNSQGVVDGRVHKAGVSTAAPNRSALLCGWMDQG